MNPAAILQILVEAKGVTQARRDVRGLESDLERTNKRGSAAMGAFAAASKGALMGVGAAAVFAAPKIIDLASDAEETASKFRTVFGPAADDAKRKLDEFSRATGTSRFAMIEQAAQFQALIRPMGLASQEAGKMSVGLTKLATDLASFNNTSVQEAMTALQSGLVGEAEPLRRFGVQLSATRVEAFAYANGIAKTGTELTAAQKAQASYRIILKDTSLAQGDATRTADSFANQFKRLKNQVTDLATELGIVLLPSVRAAVTWINNAVREMRTGTGEGGKFARVVGDIASGVGTLVEIVRTADLLIDRWRDTMLRTGSRIGKAVQPVLEDLRDVVKEIAAFFGDLVAHAKEAVEWIGQIKVPKIPDLNPFGGPSGGSGGPGIGLFNSVQQIADASLGWGLSGGRGPDQAFRPGDPGWHGQNRARDLSGAPGAMFAFASMLMNTMGSRLLELIYSPMGVGIKNGQVVNILGTYGRGVYDDHFDHVHVAMRHGGKVPGFGSGDRVPAMLEPGEFVMRKRIVDQFGPTFFAGLNGMRAGGMVGAGGPTISSMTWALEAMEGALAFAKTTAGIADDLEWLTAMERTLDALVKEAHRIGRADLISRFAPQLTSVRREIGDLTAPAPVPVEVVDIAPSAALPPAPDPEQERRDAIAVQLVDLMAQQVENQKRLIALAEKGDAATAAVAAAISGSIGGRLGLGGLQAVGSPNQVASL